MPKDRKPDAAPALTNAERQANYRARRQTLQAIAVIHYRRPPERRSRPQRWRDAVAELLALQAEYAAWFDALPDSLSQTSSAEALQDKGREVSVAWRQEHTSAIAGEEEEGQ